MTGCNEECFHKYIDGDSRIPLLLEGDALSVLGSLPDKSVDCVMTSPPYWSKREYDNGGLGMEVDYRDYIRRLAAICSELWRVLKNEGSFWLNIGDTYKQKSLLGIPWRMAFTLTDEQNWVLRNKVVWNKVKSGMDNTTDRLGSVHEDLFHFTKQAKEYYYDVDVIRTKRGEARVVNGAIVSSSGVTGVRYRRQIELSASLTSLEKEAAFAALEDALAAVGDGVIADFRMIIRGQQRATHSDSERVSGRAKELRNKGFYIMRNHRNGSKPTDVWDILPEDTQRRDCHFAPYPVDLCRIPILATCPPDGIVLDPFCGTGTTLVAAHNLGRKSVGIDISGRYIGIARNRVGML